MAEHSVLVAEVVVDAGHELVLRVVVEGRADGVVGAGRVGQRLVLINDRDRPRIQTAGGDDAARKRLAGHWIPDGALARKISLPHRRRQEVGLGDRFPGFPNAFKARHEEGSPSSDRSAQHASELIPLQFGLGTRQGREEIACVEVAVTHVVGQRALERAAAGFELHVHTGARVAPILGRVVAGLDVDLFNDIERREHHQDVVAVVGDRDAVEGDLLIPRSHPAGLELAVGRDDPGGQVAKAHEVPAGHRQALDAVLGHHVPDHGALRFQQLTLGHDRNRFGHFAEL